MFPDSSIASDFRMSQTKCKYLIEFGIHPWIMEEMKKDFKGQPFSYKFDETTTSQVKKQYDVDHFFEIGQKISRDIDFLLQIEMDGPNTNLYFLEMVIKELIEKYDKTIVDVRTCGLHIRHNGFAKALGCLSFDFNGFAYDLWYFFKNSAARREDFKFTELATEIECQILLRHVPSRC